MKLFARLFTAALILVAGITLSSRAAAPTTKPSGSSAAKSIHINRPWSEIASLTDEQRTKIHDIHAKTLEDRRALDKKERDEIMSLLSDDQKKELAKAETSGKAPKPADSGATDEKKD